MRRIVAALILSCLTGIAGADTAWPIQDGTFAITDFRFGTGEVLPRLLLHYLTLGTRHTDAQGHTDNAVLLLLRHGRRCRMP